MPIETEVPSNLRCMNCAKSPVRGWMQMPGHDGESCPVCNSVVTERPTEEEGKTEIVERPGSSPLKVIYETEEFQAQWAALHPFRVSRKVPLNVYEGDRSVCQCHNEIDAAKIVAALNHVYGAEHPEPASAPVFPDAMFVDDADIEKPASAPGEKCVLCHGSGVHLACPDCDGTGEKR